MIRALAPLAVAAALGAGSGSVSAAGLAQAPTPVPAPAGTGDAAALELAPFDTCVSCTSASAGPEGTRARATALRLLGHDVSGGTSRNGSSQRDALLALPSNPVLDLAVAGWETGTQTGGPPAAQSRTALLDLGVLPAGEDSTTGGLVTVAVLESFGDATWSGSSSGGYGASNGADIGLADGAVIVLLLHSQATSDGHDNAYVASVDGGALFGAGGDGAGTALGVPGVLGLTLFPVSAGGGGGSAAVGTVDHLLSLPGPAAGVLTSAAHGLPRAMVSAATAAPPATRDRADATPPRAAIRAPATGAPLGLGAALLVLGGAAVAALSLRPRRPG